MLESIGGQTMLVKVTGVEGGTYLINPDRIALVERYRTKAGEEASTIVFETETFLRVSETLDEIWGIVERSKNEN